MPKSSITSAMAVFPVFCPISQRLTEINISVTFTSAAAFRIGIVSRIAVPAVIIGGSRTDAALSYDEASKILTLELSEIPTEKNIEVCFETGMRVAAANRGAQAYEILNRAQISYDKKEAMFEAVKKQRGDALLTILSMEENTTLTGALAEIMSDPLP